jgi:hypothetical protein
MPHVRETISTDERDLSSHAIMGVGEPPPGDLCGSHEMLEWLGGAACVCEA